MTAPAALVVRRALLLCLVLVLAVALPSFAQTVSGTIQGTVTDGSGSPLPGVTVTARNIDTGFERVVVTNDKGLYSAPFVPIGDYRVTATLAGLGTVVQDQVDVGLNYTRIIDFELGMQAVDETITVMADQPRINRVNAETKGSLTAEEVMDRPLAVQNGPTAFLDLASTFAGFNENPTSGQNNPTASSGSSINFGAGTRAATFQIDGVNNDDSSENQHRQGVPLSTIKEFQILTGNYTAEFGRGHGAVVLVQTKSGTNEVAGDVYGFYNDNKWNAKSYFFQNSPRAEQHRELYGFTSGFPIVRDRLHTFLSFEGGGLKGEANTTKDIVTDDLLALPRLTRGNDTPANRAFIDDFLARFPTTVPNRPDLGPRRWETLQNRDWPDDDMSLRFDFDANSEHHITSRFQTSAQKRETDDVIIGENAIQDHDQQNFGLTWTQVWSQNVVGEFRYGLGIRDTNVNIAAGNDTPIIRFTGVTAGSIVGNAGGFPIQRDQKDNQFVYNLSAFAWDNHQLKAGFDIRRQQLDDLADNNSRGFWTFTTACGGQTYATPYHAMMDGCVTTYQQGYGNFFLENELDEENFYVEDSWQARSNLTLNLGVRYESVSAPQESEDRIDYGYADADYVDPRLSFAYTLGDVPGLRWLTGGPDKSVIRAGYGSFHGRVFQSIFSQGGANVRFNPPNAANVTFSNQTNLADPTNGFTFTPGIPPTARVSLAIVQPDLEMPETKQWNFTFEREMPWSSSMRVTYENKEGSNLLRYTLDNLPLSPLNGPVTVPVHPFNGDLGGQVIDTVNTDPCAGTGLPGVAPTAACPNTVPLGPNEVSLRVPRTNERRPNPLYTTNLQISDAGRSEYEAITLEWVKRFTESFHFQTSYTYSEFFDNTSEATFVGAGDSNINGPDDRFAWGRSRFDTPHQFKFYGSYRLPFFEDRDDWVGGLLGGWEIAPVIKYASGTPFTVIGGGLDLNFDGFAEGRPVILDPSIEGRTINNPSTSTSRLPVGAFRPATLGDSIESMTARNAFRSDNLQTLDLGVYKSFPIASGINLMVRFEVFNVTDEVQFGIPSNNITAANFGTITGTAVSYIPRTMQVGFRLFY